MSWSSRVPLVELLVGLLVAACGSAGAQYQADIVKNEADSTRLADVPGDPLSPEDFDRGRKMDSEHPPDHYENDPLMAAGGFEGDIAGINLTRLNEIDGPDSLFKNAVQNPKLKWTSGIVPYTISSSFAKEHRSMIAKAMDQYHKKTCLKFVPRTHQNDYISIFPGLGCSSYVGRQGGEQHISLGQGCVYLGVILHELMHALGFWHEQSRPDRDGYIQIIWENIIDGLEYNFKKYSWSEMQSLGVEYNVASIMHYGPYAFAKDSSKPTIIPLKDSIEMGQRRYFSDSDLEKINRLYQCQRGLTPTGNSTLPIIFPEGCKDGHVNCEAWAQSDECSKNPLFMELVCRKSCKTCGRVCRDRNPKCKSWALSNECVLNAPYMTVYCKDSCKMCNIQVNDENECKNHNPYCDQWAADNQCEANASWMSKYCRKACDAC